MKFLADMPISPKTVEHLRIMGHEAVRLNDLGMQSAEDKEVIEYARRKGAVILTMDLDFGGLLVQGMRDKPSVITFRLKNPAVARMHMIFDEILQGIEEYLEKGALVTVEDTRIRVRELSV